LLRDTVIGLFAVAAASLGCLGCKGAGDVEPAEKADEAVTDIPGSRVLDQGRTGNCWLYATAAWAESLHASELRSAGHRGEVPQFSPAYWLYWKWLAAIVGAESPALTFGGTWGEAVELIEQYGLVRLGSFVKDDVANVLAAKGELEASLERGALRTRAARADRRRVRAELDRAFRVLPTMKERMTSLFGASLERSFMTNQRSGDALVVRADELRVRLPRRDQPAVSAVLSEAIGKRDPSRSVAGYRVGPLAWTWMGYPDSRDERSVREFYRRIQRALNAGAPLPNTWLYLPAAYEGGSLRRPPAAPQKKSASEWHVTLIVDYEAENVPGVGRLPAGVVASAADAQSALSDEAKVTFLRVKNSWGEIPGAGPPGHTDLYGAYTDGAARLCEESGDDCFVQQPLVGGVTLPSGF